MTYCIDCGNWVEEGRDYCDSCRVSDVWHRPDAIHGESSVKLVKTYPQTSGQNNRQETTFYKRLKEARIGGTPRVSNAWYNQYNRA